MKSRRLPKRSKTRKFSKRFRLGVGYSDFFVDGFFLVVPGDVLGNISPEFDVFVRF
jgi:hypothetical protein